MPASGGSASGGEKSRKSQLVSGAGSFAEGEARLAPGGDAPVQMEKSEAPGPADADKAGQEAKAEGTADTASPDAKADGGAAPASGGAATDKYAEERGKLDAAGRAALAALPETSSGDASQTPGKVGQGEIGAAAGVLPEWFMEIQGRLVASTVWGEKEEAAQHAIRDYAMLVAKEHAGPDGKVPGHIQAFFEYIGRGSKNDAAAKKGGYKGSSALGGAAGAKNWCAGAATAASNIAKKEGREGVLAFLKSKGLEPSIGVMDIFWKNLASLSGSTKSRLIYGGEAYSAPLEPGDRVDYLFDGCQYGGHAVHVVADLGDAFLHVSGNTTKHSAVATGAAKRCKTKPAGLDLTTATSTDTAEKRTAATQHIAKASFGGGALTYSITRDSDPYKALSMLETEDPAALDAAMKKLYLKRGKSAEAAAPAPAKPSAGAPGGGGGA
ncbi:MAG: hypothetical protein U1F43_27075 [Myxococcota bacterium]